MELLFLQLKKFRIILDLIIFSIFYKIFISWGMGIWIKVKENRCKSFNCKIYNSLKKYKKLVGKVTRQFNLGLGNLSSDLNKVITVG